MKRKEWITLIKRLKKAQEKTNNKFMAQIFKIKGLNANP
jgi:hypothetical protein